MWPFKRKLKPLPISAFESWFNIGVSLAIRDGSLIYLGNNAFCVADVGFILEGDKMRTNTHTYPIPDKELHECLHQLTTTIKPVTLH